MGLTQYKERQIDPHSYISGTTEPTDTKSTIGRFTENAVDSGNDNFTPNNTKVWFVTGETHPVEKQFEMDLNKTRRQKRSDSTVDTCRFYPDPVCPSKYETMNLTEYENGIKRVVVCESSQPAIENTLLECREAYKCENMKLRNCSGGQECFEDVRVPVACIATKPVIVQAAMI